MGNMNSKHIHCLGCKGDATLLGPGIMNNSTHGMGFSREPASHQAIELSKLRLTDLPGGLVKISYTIYIYRHHLKFECCSVAAVFALGQGIEW